MIKPLFKNVLAEYIPQHKKIGSLFAPEGALRFERAKVIEVGSEVEVVKPGDIILFGGRAGVAVYDYGKEYIAINVGSIYGVEIPEEGAEEADASFEDVPAKSEKVLSEGLEEIPELNEVLAEEEEGVSGDSPSNEKILRLRSEARGEASGAGSVSNPAEAVTEEVQPPAPKTRLRRKRSPKTEG